LYRAGALGPTAARVLAVTRALWPPPPGAGGPGGDPGAAP
jgi:hypothetical protein